MGDMPPPPPPRPKAVLFDVNQTLFSLEPVGERMRQAGLAKEQNLQVGPASFQLQSSKICADPAAAMLQGACAL